MKKLICLLFATSCISSFASLLVYEPFAYPLNPTNLSAQTTGLTWLDSGTSGGATPTNRPYVVSGSLSWPGLAPTVGNSVHFGGRGNSAVHPFSPAVNSGTIYYSFVARFTAVTNVASGASGVFIMAITSSSFTAGGNEPNSIAAGFVVKTNIDGTTFDLGVKKAGGGIVLSGGSFGLNTNIFVVLAYQFVTGPGTGTGDIASLWINPNSSTFNTSTPPAATVTSTGSADLPTGSSMGCITLFNRVSTSLTPPQGVMVDQLAVGTTWADVTLTNVPLTISNQPKDQRAIAGGQASFSVSSSIYWGTFQWQHNGVPVPNATNSSFSLNPVQESDAGTYNVVVSSPPSSLTSSNAVLTVFPDIYPRLVPLWSLAPLSRPYLSVDSANQPNQRGIAYNALSNQVLVVTRTNLNFAYPTNAQIFVLNADSGADLYQMNTDTNVITGGLDIGGGTNFITLNYIDVAADGAVYAANVGTNNDFKLYYWSNSAAATEPALVWAASDPFSPGSAGQRWGNVFAVRGSGTGTQLLVDNQNGNQGSILSPNPGHPVTDPWAFAPFSNAAGGVSGGRTLLYYGSDNTFWEKHGGELNLVSYNTGAGTSTVLTNYATPNTLAAFNSSTNTLVIVNVGSDTNAPDKLDQYDLSDPAQPLFVRSYNFPANHHDNNNGTGRVIFNGDRVYALDSNNGMAAWTLEPVLQITRATPNVVLSWYAGTPGYTLQATPSFSTAFTNVSTGTLIGNQYFVTNAISGTDLFYRLKK